MSYVLPAAPVRGRSSGPGRARSTAMLFALLLIGVVAGAFAFSAALGAALHLYPTTPRVSWAPPVLSLAIVRLVLAGVTAVAEWLVWLRQRDRRVGTALGFFVAQQVLSTAWPVVFFAGFQAFGIADLWVSVGLLLLTDLLLVAATFAFWTVSRVAAVLLGLHLVSTLLATALVLGSAGMHAVL